MPESRRLHCDPLDLLHRGHAGQHLLHAVLSERLHSLRVCRLPHFVRRGLVEDEAAYVFADGKHFEEADTAAVACVEASSAPHRPVDLNRLAAEELLVCRGHIRVGQPGLLGAETAELTGEALGHHAFQGGRDEIRRQPHLEQAGNRGRSIVGV